MTSKQKWILVLILAAAIFFRFYQIKAMPGGLFPDEAANGLDINLMQQGQLQPFYERGNGREALFFYMLWGSVEVFGKGAWQHHIISALIGVLAVLGCYLVTRQLFSMFNPNKEDRSPIYIALLSAFFMATSTWHIVMSRTAFRANLAPLFATFTFYFMLKAWSATARGKRYLYSALTGAMFALGFYSYIGYRIMVPLLGIAVLWPFLADIFQSPRFANFKRLFGPGVIAGLSFTAVIAPLAYYFFTHAGSFIGRSSQVSIFNEELNNGNLIGTAATVFWTSIRAYFWEGDLNWRHNISGEPFLSIIISPFFAIGLVLVTYWAALYVFTPIKRKAHWKYFMLAGWFWSMLLPVVTTAEGIPHGLRSIGTIPAVFIMAAVGFMTVVKIAEYIRVKYWPYITDWQKTFIFYIRRVTAIAFIAALLSQTYILYFVYAANSPENFYAFRSDLTPVTEYLKSNGDKSDTYLVLDKFSVQTVDYITTVDGAHPENRKNQPYTQVDPEDSWKLSGLQPGDQIVFTQSSIFDIKKFKQYHPEATLVQEDRNQFSQTVMAVYIIR